VLSEIPEEWGKLVAQWRELNKSARRSLEDGRVAPDNNEEYLLYQTILGAWPWEDTPSEMNTYLDRLKEYSTKALSEAKINLSWLNPDQTYVDAIHAFLTDILCPQKNGQPSPFVQSVQTLLPRLRLFGAVNSLAQLVLKVSSPGVPDFYQGTDLWDLSLVDPDNRRPVDYTRRRRYLDEMKDLAAKQGALSVAQQITSKLNDGRIKLWTMHRALELRRQYHDLFRHGSYQPLYLEDDKKEHLIAFTRTHAGETLVALMPRFSCSLMAGNPTLPLADVWKNSALSLPGFEGRELRNIFTDEHITIASDGKLPLNHAFANFPVALLTTTH
jgi:(1->4)-alpha-D-glucan 1-alpha-D-glucosylmutase